MEKGGTFMGILDSYTHIWLLFYLSPSFGKKWSDKHTLSKDFSFIFNKPTNGQLLNSVSAVTNTYLDVFEASKFKFKSSFVV